MKVGQQKAEPPRTQPAEPRAALAVRDPASTKLPRARGRSVWRQRAARPLALLTGGLLLGGAAACETTPPAPSGSGGALGTGGAASGAAPGSGGLTASGGATSGGGTTASGGAEAQTGGQSTSGGAPGSGGDGGSGWNGCDEFQLPADCTIPEGAVLPGELRCTGLYSNWETRTLRCGVTEYAPAYELWSDGAEKLRYVWLPPGETIDVSNPDDFDYPVGTRFWKEFHVGPPGNQKLGETRLMLRAEAGWLYTAYVWSEDGTTATQQNDGVTDLFGTGHSVPSREQCRTCHIGRDQFILGWDFIMLSAGATGVTAQTLADEGRFSGLDPSLLDLTIPGDDVEQAALTYLHANCGVSCHNTTPDATANPSGLYLRLEVDALGDVQETAAAAGINQLPGPNAMFGDLPNQPTEPYYDFRPLDPERSLALARMEFRGSETAMPPLGTHVADPDGVALVRAWIEAMTEERGYPAAAE